MSEAFTWRLASVRLGTVHITRKATQTKKIGTKFLPYEKCASGLQRICNILPLAGIPYH